MQFRSELRPTDEAAVRALVAATGHFSAAEIDLAAELVAEGLARGEASGYRFLFADGDEGLLGYTCFGAIPATQSSWDLYWIAVQPQLQGRGLGRRLVEATEAAIRLAGGQRVYIDTSGRELYQGTRGFYERCGYAQAAFLPDFYAPGDGKVIFARTLPD